MRIKRFEAPDTTTALAMVKEEMGEDAVILATRTIGASRGNIVKKGQESRVEVVAAMDYDLEALTSDDAPPPSAVQTIKAQSPTAPQPTLRDEAPPARVAVAREQGPERIPIAASREENSASHLEAHDLRMRFAGMLKQQRATTKSPARPAASPRPAPQPQRQQRPKPAAKPQAKEIAEWRDQLIDQLAVIPLPEVPSGQGPEIIALVGATGVGKTTTAAKLAAWFSLRHGLSVALFSMDCYRIGATDQLRTYAKIMRLPCEIVLRKQDLARAVAAHADKDVIIIDTAGKSPYDQNHIEELQQWFDQQPAIAPFLVLSATTKKEDLANTVNSYEPLAVAGLILTKLDETRTYATLCQQVVASQLPVASLCVGQRVPEDFMVASRPLLTKLFRQGWQAVIDERSNSGGQNQWAVPPQRNEP